MSTGFYHTGGPGRRRPPSSPIIPPPEYDTPNYLKNYNEWVAFHNKNPRVYQLICKYAQEAIDADHKNYGIGAIFEVMRWDYTVRTDDPGLNFKFPHNHRAFYSRMWRKNHPEYAGLFRLAVQRSGRKTKTDEYGRPI
jgi:hypothetical protein